MTPVQRAFCNTHRKSPFVAVLLAILFGPLGLFYTSLGAGLAFSMATAGLGLLGILGGVMAAFSVTLLLPFIIIWLASIVVNNHIAIEHNDKVEAYVYLHSGLVPDTDLGSQ